MNIQYFFIKHYILSNPSACESTRIFHLKENERKL
nr:MAG TPA: hypothetical protein [Crassvirales sp.]